MIDESTSDDVDVVITEIGGTVGDIESKYVEKSTIEKARLRFLVKEGACPLYNSIK